ncbi:hypothetical protein [Streptosporangium carneum]|uniref:hypothetical protein n=1 Tax=Streptosporangium carneum TaxID=47481 RepID=UPI0022F2A89A|nr:hypothetical protein [Streptosporangium carneum]
MQYEIAQRARRRPECARNTPTPNSAAETRHLADVAGTEISDALTTLWGGCAPATWNRNRAAAFSWLTWCAAKKRWAAPAVPADAERRRENVDHTKAVPKTKLERLLSRCDIPLRDNL